MALKDAEPKASKKSPTFLIRLWVVAVFVFLFSLFIDLWFPEPLGPSVIKFIGLSLGGFVIWRYTLDELEGPWLILSVVPSLYCLIDFGLRIG